MTWNHSPYQTTWSQLLAEERRLRQMDQALLGAYRKLLERLAQQIAPHLLDERKRRDPLFAQQATPDAWHGFFAESLPPLLARHQNDRWATAPEKEPERNRSTASVSQPPPLPEMPPEGDAADQEVDPLPSVELLNPWSQDASGYCKRLGISLRLDESALGLNQENWPQDVLFLALLGRTGWAAHRSVATELGRWLGRSQPHKLSGTDNRQITRLVSAGLVATETLATGNTRLKLVRLSEAGKRLLQKQGQLVVPSEWEILQEKHGGSQQQGHGVQVCLFTYLARSYGWQATVCPALPTGVTSPAQPDVLLEREGERLYVEVEAGSGEVERRMAKWRNLGQWQGRVALAAPSPALRRTLVAEAQAAGTQGVATDMTSLRPAWDEKQNDIWLEAW